MHTRNSAAGLPAKAPIVFKHLITAKRAKGREARKAPGIAGEPVTSAGTVLPDGVRVPARTARLKRGSPGGDES